MQKSINDFKKKTFTVNEIKTLISSYDNTPAQPDKLYVITPENKFKLLDIIKDLKGSEYRPVKILVFYETDSDPIKGTRMGHWCCMGIKGKDIYFFDSLGLFPDDELDKISPDYRKATNQGERVVGKILYQLANRGFRIHYNDLPFQETGPGINTCGRYCALFLGSAINGKGDPYLKMVRLLNPYKEMGEYYDDAIIRYNKDK
jgi:hypothetical protein